MRRLKCGVENAAGVEAAGRLEEPAAQAQRQLGLAGAGVSGQQYNGISGQTAFQLPQFVLPADQAVLPGGGDLQVVGGRRDGVEDGGGQRVGLRLGNGRGDVRAGLDDGGAGPIPDDALAVQRNAFRRIHQGTAQGSDGGGRAMAARHCGVESAQCRPGGVGMQGVGQYDDLGNAGVGDGLRHLAPGGRIRLVRRGAGGNEGDVDVGGGQGGADGSRRYGVGGAGGGFQQDGAVGVQDDAVQVGEVVVIGVAFQLLAQCVPGGRARMVQGGRRIEAFQGGDGGVGQAAATDGIIY